MIEDYQKRWNEANAAVERLKKEMESAGFFIEGGMVKKDESCFGLFWESTLIGNHIEDGVYACFYSKGAVRIARSDLEKMLFACQAGDFAAARNIIEAKSELPEEALERLEDFLAEEDDPIDLSRSSVLSVELHDEEIEEYSFADFGSIEIRKTSLSEIEAFGTAEEQSQYCA